jgi:hypothetical protein
MTTTRKAVDTSDWSKRNCEISSDGTVTTRRAWGQSTGVFGNYVDGFTVLNGRTNTIWHYLLKYGSTFNQFNSAPSIEIYDEDFTLITTYSFTGGYSVTPCMTYAIVEDEIIICCPGLPTVAGLIGSGLSLATLTTPVNQNTSSLANFPSGICVQWAGRCAIADGLNLYFSDALAPRSFAGANFINPPGEFIYGLHVNSGGALIIVTAKGVYALPEDSSTSGPGGIVLPVWSKLNDYNSKGYKKSVSYDGRVWGLTKSGMQIIDSSDSEEVKVSEMSGLPSFRNFFKNGRIYYDDYNVGFLSCGKNGPVLFIDSYYLYTDIKYKFFSWSTYCYAFDPIGNSPFVLTDVDGEDIFCIGGGFYLKTGNYGETSLMGSVAGKFVSNPRDSKNLRSIAAATDNAITITMLLNSQNQQVVNFPNMDSPVIGVDSWGAGKFLEPQNRSTEFYCVERGDEFCIEIVMQGNPASIPQVLDIQFKGPGKTRPTR